MSHPPKKKKKKTFLLINYVFKWIHIKKLSRKLIVYQSFLTPITVSGLRCSVHHVFHEDVQQHRAELSLMHEADLSRPAHFCTFS